MFVIWKPTLMHIPTHHDRIWQTGCQQEEDIINLDLDVAGISHCLVDAVQFDLAEITPNFVTDNHFNVPLEYTSIAPEFWHIYLCPKINYNEEPQYIYNCNMNRISGERLMLFYMLAENNLLDIGLVNFNCLYHQKDPSIQQRIENYKTVHKETNWTKWDKLHDQLLPTIPRLLPGVDPDIAAMSSQRTLVVESYVSDTVIAFSEKIFRALQTPRPWLLFSSPGSVNVLRNYGFDVMDDVIDHSYDEIVDAEQRCSEIIKSLQQPIDYFVPRYNTAVETNQAILDQLKHQWSYKFQSILSNNQS